MSTTRIGSDARMLADHFVKHGHVRVPAALADDVECLLNTDDREYRSVDIGQRLGIYPAPLYYWDATRHTPALQARNPADPCYPFYLPECPASAIHRLAIN